MIIIRGFDLIHMGFKCVLFHIIRIVLMTILYFFPFKLTPLKFD